MPLSKVQPSSYKPTIVSFQNIILLLAQYYIIIITIGLDNCLLVRFVNFYYLNSAKISAVTVILRSINY